MKRALSLLVITVCCGIAPAGETLYNGIVLPAQWPPQPKTFARQEPVTPPYLVKPPKVIPIDVGRQLFVDDFLIQKKTGLKRTFHLPEYYKGNPILKPDKSWERSHNKPVAAPYSGGVWWDPKDQIFKMWYMGGWTKFVSYATSRDGITWAKPILGKGTNSVKNIPIFRDSVTVWLDLETGKSAERYKLFRYRANKVFTHYSADGINWSKAVATSSGTGDRSTLFYNPFRKVWVYSLKGHNKQAGGRCRFYAETRDLSKMPWGKSVRTLPKWACADMRDKIQPNTTPGKPDLYNLDAAPYESLMLGQFVIHSVEYNKNRTRPKIKHITLAYSRDGFHWERPDRRAFLNVSKTRKAWNYGNMDSVGGGCLVMGDKLYFYCSGRNRVDESGMTTGLAILRRDGFASMDGSGTLTTRPVTFKGKHLFVNVDNPQGELQVEVLSEGGGAISPFTRSNCTVIKANRTLQAVTWKDGGDLSKLAGRKVRFRFHLKNSKLYSFWVSPDKSGASHGYIAGGGPGFTSNKDTVGKAAYQAAEPVMRK